MATPSSQLIDAGHKMLWPLACLHACLHIAVLWCLAELLFAIFLAQMHQHAPFWLVGWGCLFVAEQQLAAYLKRIQAVHADQLHSKWRGSLLAAFLDTTGASDTAHAFTSNYVDDVDKTRAYITHYMPHFASMVMLFGWVSLLLLFIQPVLSFLLLMCMLLLAAAAAAVGIKVKKTQQAQSHTLSTLNEYFVTILQGIDLVRYYGVEHQFDHVIDYHARRFQRLTMRLLYFAFITVGFVEMLQGALIGASLVIIGLDAFNQVVSLFALLLILSLLQPLRMLLEQFHSKSAASNAVARISKKYPNWRTTSFVHISAPAVWQEITLRNVSFVRDDRLVFEEVNWRIGKGQYWHLQGNNGVGKSTLLLLLAGLLRQTSGSIERMVDGMVYPFEVEEQRALCAVVEQTPRLLHASVADNLRLGHADATEQMMQDVLVELGLDAWLTGLSDGLNTKLASNNRSLSGGQAARLALARALLAQRDVLLLDEWRNALDKESCGIVERAINKRHQAGTTIIEISHTLVKQASHICILSAHGCTYHS